MQTYFISILQKNAVKNGETRVHTLLKTPVLLYCNCEGDYTEHISKVVNTNIMLEPRKLILDKFQEHLEKGFTEYCLRHQLEASNHNFSTYIIDQNLITLSYLQRFAVIREYEYMMERDACSKSIMVNTLAHRFSISERTVWEILKNVKTPKGSEKVRNTG